MARPRIVSDSQILGAMRESVIAHGSKVSLDQVASRLGVTAPALLKRFGSREELVLQALRPPENPEWIEQVQRGPGSGPLQDQLLEVFTKIADFMEEVVPCITALRESGISHDKILPKNGPPERALKALHTWLKAARDKGLVSARETETAAYAILGALQTRAFFAHVTHRDFSARSQRRYVEELAAFFARALSSSKKNGPRAKNRIR